jgi:CheY-like chemotaxis protein
MELRGHEVTVRYSAREGLVAAQRFHPQVVLHDIAMPGMSGYEAVSSMRKDPALQDTLIIAITAFDTAEDRKRAREAGFDHFLVKPPDLHFLSSLIEHRKQ